jgi:hypothetical protein
MRTGAIPLLAYCAGPSLPAHSTGLRQHSQARFELEMSSGWKAGAVELSNHCGCAWAGGNHHPVTNWNFDPGAALNSNSWTGLTAPRPVKP